MNHQLATLKLIAKIQNWKLEKAFKNMKEKQQSFVENKIMDSL